VRVREEARSTSGFFVEFGFKTLIFGLKMVKKLKQTAVYSKKSLNFENFLIKTCTPYFFAVSLQRSFKVHLG
jgi:hypothetical protein